MSDAERRLASNLLWVCCNCHKKVDNDELTYPADLLYAWKAEALAYAGMLRSDFPTERRVVFDCPWCGRCILGSATHCAYCPDVRVAHEDARMELAMRWGSTTGSAIFAALICAGLLTGPWGHLWTLPGWFLALSAGVGALAGTVAGLIGVRLHGDQAQQEAARKGVRFLKTWLAPGRVKQEAMSEYRYALPRFVSAMEATRRCETL